ncbi:helix-turn-helix domain-containing protein [uncultured Amnibacterium sp.]|uniref:helix-turn-helix domain-containing protein n=1 Tax=uncultured Amnibacterium sp. TaxID=1631851 RepID=UPI0035C98B91
MDARSEIGEFLTTRRDRLTPAQAGLPDFGGRRRVKGLRREEVALLAGMSTEYYTRLERGNAAGVSEAILEGISRALHLDAAEHAHLFDLVRNAGAGVTRQRRRPAARAVTVRPSLQQTLDAMETVPAVIQNARLDLVATNPMGRALFAEQFDMPERPANAARYLFLDPRAHDFFDDRARTVLQTVAALRIEAGRSPYDRALSDLIGELSTRSEEFRTVWASHDVREHVTGTKRLHHRIVGELDLTYEVMRIASDGLGLVVYTAAAGSPSHDGLKLLATWVATTSLHEQSPVPQSPRSDPRDPS